MNFFKSIKRRINIKKLSKILNRQSKELLSLDINTQDKWLTAYETAKSLYENHIEDFFKAYRGQNGIFDFKSPTSFNIVAATNEVYSAINQFERAKRWLKDSETLEDFVLRGENGRYSFMYIVESNETTENILNSKKNKKFFKTIMLKKTSQENVKKNQ